MDRTRTTLHDWRADALHRLLTAVNTTFFASSALAGPLVMGASLPSVEEKDQDDQVVKLAEAGGV